jgi:hypothetical protein
VGVSIPERLSLRCPITRRRRDRPGRGCRSHPGGLLHPTGEVPCRTGSRSGPGRGRRVDQEVEADRLHGKRELASTAGTVQPLTEAEIRALVASQRKVLCSLAKATPEQRATIYGETMGLRITYNPGSASIEVEVRPACSQVCVGGGT